MGLKAHAFTVVLKHRKRGPMLGELVANVFASARTRHAKPGCMVERYTDRSGQVAQPLCELLIPSVHWLPLDKSGGD